MQGFERHPCGIVPGRGDVHVQVQVQAETPMARGRGGEIDDELEEYERIAAAAANAVVSSAQEQTPRCR
jgi:hypothetical protein